MRDHSETERQLREWAVIARGQADRTSLEGTPNFPAEDRADIKAGFYAQEKLLTEAAAAISELTKRCEETDKPNTPILYGHDCPKGMVQVEFVGVDPDARYSKYGYRPTKTAFIELYVDGERFRIDAGDIGPNCCDGKPRRGIHINGPFRGIGDLSVNALVYTTSESEPLSRNVFDELNKLREEVASLKALLSTTTASELLRDDLKQSVAETAAKAKE